MDGSNNKPATPTTTLKDIVESNPYLHFLVSEFYATLASAVVYCFARFIAFVIQLVDDRFPLRDNGPLSFLELIMGWGGALATTAVFTVITLYQLLILLKRLYRELGK
jgi:hypothetical protein